MLNTIRKITLWKATAMLKTITMDKIIRRLLF